MKRTFLPALCLVMSLSLTVVVLAQQSTIATPRASSAGVVPQLINYSGVLKDNTGKTLTTISGVTFLIYRDEQGGAPLWMETQNVTPDRTGRYSVQLGSTRPEGLPAEIFQSGEARWMAVQLAGEAEQSRVLLVAVPYAMKAQDAATIGGLPPSAFVLAPPASANSTTTITNAATATSSSAPPPASSDVTTNGGTVNAVPLFTTATNVQNSILTQTGTTAVSVAGKLNHPSTGTATTTAGKNSQPDDYVASVFNSGTSTAVPQTFQLQAEPTGNNTSTAAGTLNLLYGSGTSAPSETGLKISNKGLITFATGQTFPGTGTGTITGITTATGSGLSGGGTSGTLSLSIPAAGVANSMLANSAVTVTPGGGMTGGGKVSLGGTTTLGLLTSCASGQILKWNGTAWACATDSNSGGTITAVTAGTGLSGGGTSGTVTLNNTGVLAVTAGTGISSTGGQSPTLSINSSVVPLLTAANTFTQGQTINGQVTAGSVNAVNGNFTGEVSSTTTGVTGLFADSSDADATTIYGVAEAVGGPAWGVEGVTNSSSANAYGVIGLAQATAGAPIGVYGENVSAADGVGVFGQTQSLSSIGQMFYGIEGVGVWGDGGASAIGVFGTSDDIGAYFNTSLGFGLATQSFDSAGTPFIAFGNTSGECLIDSSADLLCSGTKNAVVPVDGGTRHVAMSAIESPQNWFEDFGSAELVNGAAVVQLDSTFTQTVNTEQEYFVVPVPNGDCKGLYVSNRTPNSFEVHELGSGQSSIHFTYRITAIRKNYETVRFADHTKDMEKVERQRARLSQRPAHPMSHDPAKKVHPTPTALSRAVRPR